MKTNRISIHALFAEDEINPNDSADFDLRELVKSADILYAVDVNTQQKKMIYGRKLLEKISSSGESQEAGILEIEIDQETDEYEKLCALVEVVKGSYDEQ